MLGDDHLWPIDATWDFHAGGGVFHNISLYSKALSDRYGAAQDVDDYAEKSQLMAYEGIRAMYEAFSRNKYKSTGVIQWMLNNAWPSTIWHLYDYYLRPGGGYFGAKRAMQLLDPVYSYDDGSIWAVNSRYQDANGLTLKAAIYNLDMQEKFSREVTLDLPADSTRRLFALPQLQGLTPTYFLRLSLLNATGKIVGSNFYWLSSTQERSIGQSRTGMSRRFPCPRTTPPSASSPASR
jgi:exo-1,4-beta-D-glucosaminidase